MTTSVAVPWPKDPLEEPSVAMLEQVLHIWCQRTGSDPKSEVALEKARELFHWFEFGVRDPDELSQLIGMPAPDDTPPQETSTLPGREDVSA